MTPENPVKTKLLQAALPHVAFDGWGEETFRAAAADADIAMDLATSVCPRGAVDLAIAFHEAGDAAMVDALAQEELSDMRFRDRIARAVQLRLEAVEDKELVRRGTSLFSLPQHAPDGARLIWGTADKIWTALGDTSEDVNWYSKRATLSAVYGATVLFWLGDQTEGDSATWAFLDRRIDNVMQFEKVKANVQKLPLVGPLIDATLGQIRAPKAGPMRDVPGTWTDERTNTE